MRREKIEVATTEECPKNSQSDYSVFWVKKKKQPYSSNKYLEFSAKTATF
jgi:hypothetical protein